MAAGPVAAKTETQGRLPPKPRSVVGGPGPRVRSPGPVPLGCSACAEAGATCDACDAAALGLQRALRVGAADDPLEGEADRVADLVVEGRAAPARLGRVGHGVNRLCSRCAEELEEELSIGVQRKASGELPALGPPGEHPASALVAAVLGSAGNPLAHPVRAYFEPLFGRDFSAVRVHAGEQARASAAAVEARAYVAGPHLVLGEAADLRDAAGRRLLAHELVHVVQQGAAHPLSGAPQHRLDSTLRRAPAIQRDPAPGGQPDPVAARDAYYAEAVRDGTLSPMVVLGSVGSLVRLEQIGPKSYPEVRQKLVDKYGEAGVQIAYDNDARMVALAAKSEQVTDRLNTLLQEYADSEQETAMEIISAKIDAYEFTYARIFVTVAEQGEGALTLLEGYYSADAKAMVAIMREEADAAQAEALRLEAELAEWRKDGEKLVGQTVATRERFAWWDASITLTSVLPPPEGRETMGEAVAWGRLSGQACAIGKSGARYFVYQSSDQFSYDDVFSTEAFEEHRSEVVPEKASATGLPLISVEGYVLTRKGQRFFGGDQSKNPENYATGTGTLLQGAGDLDTDQAIRLFKMATLDLLLINLAQAEERLRKVLWEVFPERGQGTMRDMSLDYGAKVRADAAALKEAMTRATDVITRRAKDKPDADTEETLDEAPTDAEEAQLVSDLETIGRIFTDNPGAAMMIKTKRDPESAEPVAEGEISNQVEGGGTGDAAWAVAQESSARLEHINEVRRHFHGNLDDTLSLEPLHDALLPNFTEYQQVQIRLARAGHSFAAVAKTFGMAGLDLLLLITGAALGGPVGAGLAVAATASGAAQAAQGLREAKLTEAKSKLDVPGGFALASEEEAASAKRWAYIGVALSVLDVGELASGGRLLRTLGRGTVRAAKGAGAVAIEALRWAKTTLGLPGDVVANLSLAAVQRLQSLTGGAIKVIAGLSSTLKRVVLGCASPCRVNLAEIYQYVNDPARKAVSSTKPLTGIDDIVAALPSGSKFNRGAVKQYLKDHPAALEFILQAQISADDLGGLAAVLTRGDVSEEMARKTFSRYLTALVPAKIGPDINEFNRIAAAAGKVEKAGAANALKGPMFENFARLYVTDFRVADLGRVVYTDAMIPSLEAVRRSSDAWVSKFGELWDFKHVAGAVDPAQVRDYQRILKYEARRGAPKVTSINYLFPDRAAAEANRGLLSTKGFNVWYLGPSGKRIRLR